jgi:serine/threonine protein kinase
LIGRTIGNYRVSAKLGAGGMGEVYRARDERLGREVAIKVLPDVFAGDSQRLARFEREAQLLASLNHPHIATIYGLEDAGGVRALVMELVEGPTLSDRIQQGALPPDEALPIARQIAEALEYAHERGIVHRDLKPANIKLTADGAVRILDFGLAKALEGDPAQADISSSPTLTAAATRAGIILGTAAYMSPEQAKGKSVDRRADIWSFGVVLFEMLSGKTLYAGETAPETMAHVITKDPDWSLLPASTPPRIRALLERCLEKDPRQRLRDIGEARIEIERVLSGAAGSRSTGLQPAPSALSPLRSPLRTVLPWALCALLAAVSAFALWDRVKGRAVSSASVKRFVITLPPNTQMEYGPLPVVAISPDGERLALEASIGSGWRLYLRSLDSTEPAQVPGTEDSNSPFFSPDGQWLGFYGPGKLRKVSVQGGAPITLCDSTEIRGATWGPHDSIVFSRIGPSTLYRVPAGGGTPVPLTKLASGERTHKWPSFLPDGKALLFTIEDNTTASAANARIAVLRLDTGKWHTVLEGGTFPRYVPSGHILFARGAVLMGVPFDLAKLEVTGNPVPLIEGLSISPVTGAANFDVSREGTLVHVIGLPGLGHSEPVWVDRRGAAKPLGLPARSYVQPSLSHDGRYLALHIVEESNDVWTHDTSRGTLTRFSFQPGEDEAPLWSPDGKRLAYSASVGAEPRHIYLKNADGSGADELVASPGGHVHLSSFSPDGKFLLYTNYEAGSSGDIWLLPLEGERKPRPFLQTPFDERDAQFSPDGRWVAYTSNESGPDEVYVQGFPEARGKWQISTGGGYGPRWSPRGQELFYRIGNKVMTIRYSSETAFSPATPQVLFEGEYGSHPRREGNYAVSPDGQRFLMLKNRDVDGTQSRIQVTLNWFEELKRRVPAAKK